jgi:hypothetical protein
MADIQCILFIDQSLETTAQMRGIDMHAKFHKNRIDQVRRFRKTPTRLALKYITGDQF